MRKVYLVVAENIHAFPTEGIGISKGCGLREIGFVDFQDIHISLKGI